HLLGKVDAAIGALRQATELLKSLAGQEPSDSRYPSDWAECETLLGEIHRERREPREAVLALRQAVYLREQIVQANPNYRAALADSYHNLARMFGDAGQPDAAEQIFDKALSLRQELVAESPDDAGREERLALTHAHLAIQATRMGQPQKAEKACRQAIELQEKLLAERANDADFQEDLAGSYANLGLILQSSGRLPEAE